MTTELIILATGLDSKVKWHVSKLKCETELRETSEKKVEELTAEINQLKTKEMNRAKEDVEIERNMLAGTSRLIPQFFMIFGILIYRKAND